MPIYEYCCKKCDLVFEVLQKVNEEGKNLKCPRCQAEKPEKVFSVFSSTGASQACTNKGFT